LLLFTSIKINNNKNNSPLWLQQHNNQYITVTPPIAPPIAAVAPVAAPLAQAQVGQFATQLKFSQILV
jgi:hypothetical protein